MKGWKQKKKGISMITLIIVIIIVIILAAAIIVMFTQNNPVNNARRAQFLANVDAVKDEVRMYVSNQFGAGITGEAMYPTQINESGAYVHPEYDSIDTESKKLIAEAQGKYMYNGLYDIYNINLTKVYIVDSDKVKSVSEFPNNVLIVENENGTYSLVFQKGVEVTGMMIYALDEITFQTEREPKVFAIGNNTFKMDTNGYVRALGEKSVISGATDKELEQLQAPWKEWKPNSLVSNTTKAKYTNGTACILNNKGELYAIGDNSFNKMGLGNSYSQLEPVKLSFPEDIKVKDFFVGYTNIVVIDENNQVFVAGSNEKGEMGLGNTNTYSSFTKITGLDGSQIQEIFISNNFYGRYIMAVYANGEVWASGSNAYGAWGVSTLTSNVFVELTKDWKKNSEIAFPLKKIMSGKSLVTGILDANDTLWATGYNLDGRLGNGNKVNQFTFIAFQRNVEDFDANSGFMAKTYSNQIYMAPKAVIDESGVKIYYSEIMEVPTLPAGNLSGFCQLYYVINPDTKAKEGHQGAVVIDGKVYYLKTTTDASQPLEIVQDESVPNSIVSLSSQGVMYSIRDSKDKEYLFMQNTLTDKGINIQKDLKILKKDQTFDYVDGHGYKVHLLDGEYRLWLIPGKGEPYMNVVKSVVTRSNEYMLLANGDLYAKGYSTAYSYGSCGWGTDDYKEDFVLIQKNVKNIFGSDGGAMSITNDNKIYIFGYITGQFLYLPRMYETYKVPTLYQSALDTLDIREVYILPSNGGSAKVATYVLTTDGSLYSFGFAQVNGFGTTISDFQKLSLPARVKKITGGYNYTLCLLDNGEVYAWGTNTYGQFGNGFVNMQAYPTPQKLALDGIIDIAAGDGYGIYVKSSKEIYGSGKNEFGQLGDGTTISTEEFVRCHYLEK